jgi:hypothetical protein
LARLTSTLFVSLLLASCSMLDRDNRRLVSALDESVTPSSEAARMALLPLAVPVGTAALALDAVVLHPAVVVPDAWGDTVEVLWTSDEESSLRKALFTPLAAAATPAVFAGAWLFRSTWPVRRRTDSSTEVVR